ncbi:dTMP kinase [Labrenzia sp. EL_208]|nr:dTMP kinase [Labrenzia sp. EL_162]MBG6164047.1 dTMP kinase [Labrenzia sp. EL_195]MBG6176789.1 dTMP kinase [Labrenzia sp. EL_132]MBG6194792.1 dTMP kinase [Labrenzia sp. EL_159]MBG6200279.1 dTMP kinase [Labrenzia sp. EL_13]MBG6231406.1 dTMP kinase [Labrenzia sp. EL_208]
MKLASGARNSLPGHFITFEGGEGAGKSTQIVRLKAFLESFGKSVIVTREPGGSPGAEKIRSMLLSGGAKDLGPRGEAMLFAAARADHVDVTIKPALERGDWVLCDRYADSTRVYQGEAGVDQDYLKLLETAAIAGLHPDMTILIDVPPEIGLSRVAKRSESDESGGPDRFEDEAVAVHERRRKLFLQLALEEAYRFTIVDGSRDEDFTEQAVRKAVLEAFSGDLVDMGKLSQRSEVHL